MNAKSKDEKADELRSEYSHLGEMLKDGVQGKYAARYREGTNLVLLAPDVAEAFPTGESVNETLRLVIQLRQIPSARAKTAPKP